mgnify:CR=1 FL=1
MGLNRGREPLNRELWTLKNYVQNVQGTILLKHLRKCYAIILDVNKS